MVHRAPRDREPRRLRGKILASGIGGLVLATGIGFGLSALSGPSPAAPQPYSVTAKPFRSPIPLNSVARPPAVAAQQVAPTQVVATAPGMTLWALAQQDCGTGYAWSALYAANRAVVGSDPGFLRVGEKLTIKCH